MMDRPLTLVLCVRDAAEAAIRCVESLRRLDWGRSRLVIIDDASRQEALRERLAQWPRDDARITVIRHEDAQGFVRSANRGFGEDSGSDVLLCTSDIEVYPGFIEGMRRAACFPGRLGIATPWASRGSIVTLCPPLPDDLPRRDEGVRAFAECVSRNARRECPEIVTPVGHALYLPREVLDRCGGFSECYSPGYGEENDLGEIAKKRGFAIRLADEVFVRHEGGASFGWAARTWKRRHRAVLERRHPGYHRAVDAFLAADPLLPLRRRLLSAFAGGTDAQKEPRTVAPSFFRGAARAWAIRLHPAYWRARPWRPD